jgi:hypothetical protein
MICDRKFHRKPPKKREPKPPKRTRQQPHENAEPRTEPPAPPQTTDDRKPNDPDSNPPRQKATQPQEPKDSTDRPEPQNPKQPDTSRTTKTRTGTREHKQEQTRQTPKHSTYLAQSAACPTFIQLQKSTPRSHFVYGHTFKTAIANPQPLSTNQADSRPIFPARLNCQFPRTKTSPWGLTPMISSISEVVKIQSSSAACLSC